MSKRYIECDNCGKRLYEGDVIHKHGGLCGIYCSSQCYLESAPINHIVMRLTEEEAELSGSGWKEGIDEQA